MVLSHHQIYPTLNTHHPETGQELMTCSCINIEPGSYENQIWVHAPSHMPKPNGYCLDRCIAEEVMWLWMLGITTTGCCCGHNKHQGYIGVIEKDIERMEQLGYQHTERYPNRIDEFVPLYADIKDLQQKIKIQ